MTMLKHFKRHENQQHGKTQLFNETGSTPLTTVTAYNARVADVRVFHQSKI